MSVTAPYGLALALAVGYVAALAGGNCKATALTARALQAMGTAYVVMTASSTTDAPPSCSRSPPPARGQAVTRHGGYLFVSARASERDVLFLERALDLLRPGGRLGTVLPYNKATGLAFRALRRWLVARARVFAVVGLPRETFQPHTTQRTFVLFATRRAPQAPPDPAERAMFLVSERAGKDAAGEFIERRDGRAGPSHDLNEVLAELAPFLARQGFGS